MRSYILLGLLAFYISTALELHTLPQYFTGAYAFSVNALWINSLFLFYCGIRYPSTSRVR